MEELADNMVGDREDGAAKKRDKAAAAKMNYRLFSTGRNGSSWHTLCISVQ
jgi:hypothetical protein